MSILEIIQNRSFIHEWIIPNINISSIDVPSDMEPIESILDVSIENTFMNIYKDNNILYTLIIGKGLSESYDSEINQIKIIAAISDVSGFELGEYKYNLEVYDDENILLLQDSGIINVIENQTGETLKEVRLYDLFGPDPEMIAQLLNNNQ